MPSPFYSASEVLFQLHGGMVSHMQVLATPSSTVHNTWILTTESISDVTLRYVNSLYINYLSEKYIKIDLNVSCRQLIGTNLNHSRIACTFLI